MPSTLPPATGARDRHVLAAVASLFVLSGFAALVYQVAWQRILALHTGVSVYSVALIVSAFMAGLGLGSHLGGLLSRRLDRVRALQAFALLELGVGLFAASSAWLYYDLLYVRGGALYAAPWRAALLHFAALLPPTTLMGMSLPLVARALVRDGASAARTLGLLYGLNVVGAALGAWLAPWLLIRELGLRQAILVGAAANVAAGLGALALRRRVPEDAPPAGLPTPGPDDGGSEGASLRLWLGLYALSGFCALALEVLWFRLLDVAVKSTAFTFGTLLGVYLLGSAAGALAGARLAPRLSRPLRAFLLCQCALLAVAAAGPILLVRLPPDAPGLGWLVQYWAQTDGFRLGRAFDPGTLLRLYVALPLALFGLPTFLMGLSFPILQRAVQHDARSAGFRVGALQAANILGCVLGSLAVGLLALDRLGTAETLRLVVAVGLVFAGLGLRRERGGAFLGSGAVLVLALLLLPREEALWLRLHGVGGETGPAALVGEDASGVVALTQRAGGDWDLTVNGTWNSTLPFGGIHAALGALPAVLHEAPAEIAIVGLGSGNTAWAAACRSETRRVRVYEICRPQLGLLQELAAGPQPPAHLRRFLRDPRLEIRFADGRHALQNEPALYDMIEIDALRPYHSMSGNLYSLEFFQRAQQRLRPGGLMCSWAPTPRVHATFVQAFPHVLELGSERLLVGSREPLPVATEAWLQRLRRRDVFGYLGPEIAQQLTALIKATRPAPRGAATESDLNRDLFPRDELASRR